MPGTITLYNKHEVRLAQMRYDRPFDRKRVLTGWAETYGDKFRTFHYHISPDLDEKSIISELELKKAS